MKRFPTEKEVKIFNEFIELRGKTIRKIGIILHKNNVNSKEGLQFCIDFFIKCMGILLVEYCLTEESLGSVIEDISKQLPDALKGLTKDLKNQLN